MREVISVLKSRGFSILASFSFTLTSFLAVSIYNDVKYLVGKVNQYDIKIEALEKDVERLNNTIYYENSQGSLPKQLASLMSSNSQESILIRNKDSFILPSPPTEVRKRSVKKK